MRKFLIGLSVLPLAFTTPSVADEPWDALAECESGNTNANTGNGYYGYYQFDRQTWESTGRSGLPSDHSYAEQTTAAADLYAARGGQPWPNCWPGGTVSEVDPSPAPAVKSTTPSEAEEAPVATPQARHLTLTG